MMPDSNLTNMEVKHTELPWKVFLTKNGMRLVGIGDAEGQGICDAGFGIWSWNDPEGIANAEYIVTACNNYPALLAENGRLKEALEEARDLLTRARDEMGYGAVPTRFGPMVKELSDFIARTALSLREAK